MRELEALRRYVRNHAQLVAARVTRLHDAMHTLASLTGMALARTPDDTNGDAADRRLAALGFAHDGTGFFEREALLARIKRGEAVPDEARLYLPDALARDPDVRRRVAAMVTLGPAIGDLERRLAGIAAWIYYTDRTGFAVTYPYHDPIVPPDFAWRDYLPFRLCAPAASGPAATPGPAASSPSGAIVWTPPNVDYGGKGVTLAPCIAVGRGAGFEGVWAIDVPMSRLVGDALHDPMVEGQLAFLVDRDGCLVAHPTLEVVLRGEHGAIARESLASLGEPLASLDVGALFAAGHDARDEEQVIDLGSGARALRVVSAPIPAIGWALVSAFPLASLQAQRAAAVQNALAALSRGDTSVRMDHDTSDVIGAIAHAFNETASALAAHAAARDRATAELERSRAEVRALFDASPAAMALFDGDDRVVDENRAFAQLMLAADTAGAVAPLPLSDLLSEAREHGEAGPHEVEVVGERGPQIFSATARRLELASGPSVLAAIEDLTERRAFEARLVEAQKLRVIGRLAAGIAHDFNNLLTAIGTSADLLAEHAAVDVRHPDAADHADLVATIADASDRAGALTAQLLSFARRDVVDRRVVALGDALRDGMRLAQRMVSSDVSLALDLAPDLPAVHIDQGQLTQVLLNLVVNARDALPARGGRIAVMARRTAASAEVVVEDSGRGMDGDTLARATEPFFTTKSTGTGLGLSTVKDIVLAAGGELTLTSSPGRGTRAIVTLPAAVGSSAAPRTTPRASSEARVVVALVDDDDLVRNATERGLRHLGCEVRAFASSHAALAFLEDLREAVSLLLTDVVMPGRNGRELAEAARRVRPELPVIYMTGYTDDALVQHGIETNTARLLRKPFRPEALAEAVRSVV